MQTFKIFYLFFIFLTASFFSQIFSVSWGILPVRTLTIEKDDTKFGPALTDDRELNSKEISRIMHLYLKMSGFNAIINQRSIEHIFNKLNFSSNKKITNSELKKLSRHIDADRFLLANIKKKKGAFQIESMVYYAHSDRLTDPIITEHNNLWQLIGAHLQKRFPNIRFPEFEDISSKRPVIFALDASGGNYYEIRNLIKLIPKIEGSTYTVCAIDGYKNFSFLSPKYNISEAYQFLNKLQVKGGADYLEDFEKVLNCALKYNTYAGGKENKPVTIFLVGGVSQNESDRRNINGLLRRLSKISDILILGSGKSSLETIEFWKSASENISRNTLSIYQDITYTHEVGLSSGEAWHVHKKAFEIYETRNIEISDNDKGIQIPSHRQSEFTPHNLLKIYKDLSKNAVVSSSELSLNIDRLILTSLNSKMNYKREEKSQKNARLLIEINNIPFWIYMPYENVYSNSGEIKLNKDEYYYFLVNLKKSEKGMPLANFKNFGSIYIDAFDIPKTLILDIAEYLKNSKRYLNQSLSGSSIYILRGKLKLMRYSEKDIFDQ
ncbi:MAG: hypothetical protein OEZ13_04625 [Spirochaetia bacterium]|nr:hypothetical protein [Spirochaetia bacterium]